MKKSKDHPSRRPAFEKAFPYLLCLFIAYAIADLVILKLRPEFLPKDAPPPVFNSSQSLDNQKLSNEFYNSIISRNPFSLDGSIPDVLRPVGETAKPQEDLPPVLSSLPLTLEGTIVLTNAERSLANINVKGRNAIIPFSVGREIEGLAKVISVERKKVIIRNLNNGRLEYLEMKSEDKLSFQSGKANSEIPALSPNSDIKKVADNKFEIKRSDLTKYLSNMSAILMDAAVIPERDANGNVECYKFVNVKPDSVYTALDIQTGDSICGVNGEKVDSPQKAMALFQKLQSEPNIEIDSKRGGDRFKKNYTIK